MSNLSFVEKAGEALGRYGRANVGRRLFLKGVVGGLTAAGLGDSTAHAEDGLPAVHENPHPSRPDVTVLDSTLDPFQGLLIGGELWTNGSLDFGVRLGDLCVPYAAVVFAHRQYHLRAEVTGLVHYERLRVDEMDFRLLANAQIGPIRDHLERALAEINREQYRKTGSHVPASHFFGGIGTFANGRPDLYPVVDLGFYRSDFTEVSAPESACPSPPKPGAPAARAEAGVSGCPPAEQIGIVPRNKDGTGHMIEFTAARGPLHAQIFLPEGLRPDGQQLVINGQVVGNREMSVVFETGNSWEVVNGGGTGWDYPEIYNTSQCRPVFDAEVNADRARRARLTNFFGPVRVEDLVAQGVLRNRR